MRIKKARFILVEGPNVLIYGDLHRNQTKDNSMIDYIEKALEGDYKHFIESLIKIVGNEIDKKRIPLREAAGFIISEAFYQIRGEKDSLDILMLRANQILEAPCQDDLELENHTLDEVVEEISRKEIYMSEKTRTLPRPDRI